MDCQGVSPIFVDAANTFFQGLVGGVSSPTKQWARRRDTDQTGRKRQRECTSEACRNLEMYAKGLKTP